MLMCFFSKDKSFSENNETSWKSFETKEFSIDLNILTTSDTKNVWSFVELYDLFINRCKKISLVKHFAESTFEKDLVCLSKIISYMNKNAYIYAMFHDI